jgi:hypothetical protein
MARRRRNRCARAGPGAVRRIGGDDRGESLVELLVSVGIMATAVVALLAGLATVIIVSDMHRKQAAASAQLRTFAEAVEKAVNGSPSAYVDCASTASYSSVFTADPGYERRVLAVQYWTGTGFSGVCSSDSGVQKVTLQVRSTEGTPADDGDDRAVETLDLIIRKPCRAGDPPCS